MHTWRNRHFDSNIYEGKKEYESVLDVVMMLNLCASLCVQKQYVNEPLIKKLLCPLCTVINLVVKHKKR